MDVDYISELPADLKEKILVKLPIKETVKTSILSSKWKDAWTSIPHLVFEENSPESMTIRFVDNILIFHHGPILKFKLVSEHACNEAISRWMLILSRNRLRDLELRFYGHKRCKIPSRLFSCLALERMNLSHCIINVPRSFQGFKLLHTLSLFSFNLSGIITIANLVSGCPLLEKLTLYNFVQQGCLHIPAPNLRDLDIWGEFHGLCLETPKLVLGCIYLIISDKDHEKFLIANSGNESNIKKALGCLPNIQTLRIDAEFIDYLAMGPIPENPPTIFNCLTEISVAVCCLDREEIEVALCLFESAPILTVLNIEFLDWGGADQLEGETFWELKAPEDILFKCLKTLNITYEKLVYRSSRNDESMLEFAELVLSIAPVLEKLSIIDYVDPTVYRRELECFPKLSEKAEFVFVKRSKDDDDDDDDDDDELV